jgi:hypothetical protein
MASKRAGSQARQARQELAWGLTGFFLVQAALAITIETRHLRLCDEIFSAKLDRIRSQLGTANGKSLVVVLGSSRTQMGLDTGLLNHDRHCPWVTFNFGFEGCGPLTHRVNLRRLLQAGVRPDLVVVEVVPAQLLVGACGPIDERWLDGARCRVAELALLWPYTTRPSALLGSWVRGRLLPCVQHRTALRDWLAVDRTRDNEPLEDSTRTIDPYGWVPMSGQPGGEQVAAATTKTLNEYWREVADGQFHPGPTQALRDVLDDCRKEEIGAAVVLMPEAAAFRALYPQVVELQLGDLLISLEAEYHLRAVIDSRTWVADDGFVDSHHLQREGARVFTEHFARELRKVLERQTEQEPICSSP